MPARDYHERLWEQVPEGLVPPDFQLRRDFLLARVRSGQRVLDVGCGEGAFAVEMAGVGALVVGIDVAETPLRRGRALHPGLDLRLVDPDAPWPLEDANFDLVWAGEVIEHVPDTGGWLTEVRRVLRSDGCLVLSTPDHGPLRMLALSVRPRGFAAHFDPRADHLRFYTQRSLVALLEDFGFADVHVRRAGGVPGARRLLMADGRRAGFAVAARSESDRSRS
jgi:2-polyprenyl-3-methyl-5-hydroxy-6-metoxy-1,4-benzoquinol methylase